METQHYSNLYNYLVNKEYPIHFTSQQNLQLSKQAKHYKISNNFLYKIDKQQPNTLLRVIKQEELGALLFMMHNDPSSGHFKTDTMFAKIKTRYYWPQMYEAIRNYVKSCDACQRRGRTIITNPLHPIPVHTPFYQIGIDFVGPLPRTARNKRYIIVAMDYLTKWPEAKAVPEASAAQVATFLYEQIICQHGCPQIILSDRGTHFNNQMIQKLLEKFEVNHLLSTPYHPQTNGLVERFNRTLCESLAKLTERTNDWDLFIAPVLFAYRTSRHSTTKIEPFYLVYGRSARLPIDFTENDDPNNLPDRLSYLINDVPQIREKARNQVTQAQIKQKDRHDMKLKKPIVFQIGDKILYFKAAQDQSHSGKLNTKWKGPYYVHQVLPNGAYKIRTMEGQVLLTPVNGKLLKPYYDPMDI